MSKPNPSVWRSRLTLILLLTVCLGPFVFAWIWFSFQGPLEMRETTNAGELVRPALPLESASLPVIAARGDADEAALPVDRRWTVIYVAAEGCGADCREVLWSTRQIRLSLGRDMGRVQRVLLLPAVEADRDYFRSEHDDLMVLDMSGPEAETFIKQFDLDDGVKPEEGGRLYIADPLGNYMMYFQPGFDPDDFMDDMKRLLRVSQIG
jgi:hypothetical protein